MEKIRKSDILQCRVGKPITFICDNYAQCQSIRVHSREILKRDGNNEIKRFKTEITTRPSDGISCIRLEAIPYENN